MKRHHLSPSLDISHLDAVNGGIALGATSLFLGGSSAPATNAYANPGSFGYGYPSVSTYGVLGSPYLSSNCFCIKSWGDPHENITIDGVSTSQIDTAAGIHDLAVLHNTVGGETHVSTQTTNQEAVHQSFNREVDINGGSWAVQATANGDGHIGLAVHDARGTYEVAAGMSVHEMDGTVISNTDGKVTVHQALTDGGHVNHELSLNAANYLDLSTEGHGNAGISGWTLDKFAQEHAAEAQQHMSQPIEWVQQVQPMPAGAAPMAMPRPR